MRQLWIQQEAENPWLGRFNYHQNVTPQEQEWQIEIQCKQRRRQCKKPSNRKNIGLSSKEEAIKKRHIQTALQSEAVTTYCNSHNANICNEGNWTFKVKIQLTQSPWSPTMWLLCGHFIQIHYCMWVYMFHACTRITIMYSITPVISSTH